MILHAQLEIWKAAYSDEDLGMNWRPETTQSTASSEDVSDGKFLLVTKWITKSLLYYRNAIKAGHTQRKCLGILCV